MKKIFLKKIGDYSIWRNGPHSYLIEDKDHAEYNVVYNKDGSINIDQIENLPNYVKQFFK